MLTFHFHAFKKEMAAHSSFLAWRIPGTAEPGGLPSMESHRVGQDWSDLAWCLLSWTEPNKTVTNSETEVELLNRVISKDYLFSSVQTLSHVRLFANPWTAAHQASLSITNSQSLLKLMSIESVMPSNHPVLWYPLLPPPIFPSIRVFSNESVLHIKWPNYWSFSFSTSPSNEYSGLISFRMDCGSPYCPRDSQNSSPTPQFKSINSSALSFLYSPTLTSVHDYWKNHSLD